MKTNGSDQRTNGRCDEASGGKLAAVVRKMGAGGWNVPGSSDAKPVESTSWYISQNAPGEDTDTDTDTDTEQRPETRTDLFILDKDNSRQHAAKACSSCSRSSRSELTSRPAYPGTGRRHWPKRTKLTRHQPGRPNADEPSLAAPHIATAKATTQPRSERIDAHEARQLQQARARQPGRPPSSGPRGPLQEHELLVS